MDNDFNLDGIMDERTDKEIYIDRLRNSRVKCELFWVICNITLKKGVQSFSTIQLANLMKINPSQIRSYLEEMLSFGVVLLKGSGVNQQKQKGKTKLYFLNRNDEYYLNFLPIVKEKLGK